ncbi:DUF3796 domain-containing protein [Bacillus marinisedimentorum]|uniref:DUF3796 domain-containing protein n=1 Tax=Bacillus marinisedimentorum TaxID=1821260 RepID=UPI0008729264
MKYTWLKLFGFIGFLGFLGVYPLNPTLFSFFAFFAFFRFSKVIHDERFEENVNKASRNALIVFVLMFSLVVILVNIVRDDTLLALLYALHFSIVVLVFVFSFQHYEKQER